MADVIQQGRTLLSLATWYFNRIEHDTWRRKSGEVWTPPAHVTAAMLAYARSDETAPTRRFHSNMTPAGYVKTFASDSLLGAIRAAFIPLEPKLKDCGWDRGVPFEWVQVDGPAEAFYKSVDIRSITPELMEDPDGGAYIISQFCRRCETELRQLQFAIDAVARAELRDFIPPNETIPERNLRWLTEFEAEKKINPGITNGEFAARLNVKPSLFNVSIGRAKKAIGQKPSKKPARRR